MCGALSLPSLNLFLKQQRRHNNKIAFVNNIYTQHIKREERDLTVFFMKTFSLQENAKKERKIFY